MKWRCQVLLALSLGLTACEKSPDGGLQGWVEADLIFVSPDETGRVLTLAVREGDTVIEGDALFTLDADLQQADVAVAEASVMNARQAHERAQTLVKSAAGTQRALDEAEAALRTAEARLMSAQTRLNRRNVSAPVAGAVQHIYYRPGETVPSGRPVLALLPPANIKIRFFVSEPMLPKLSLGDPVKVSCDGCRDDISGRITFISQSSEFTPPVIYSQEERSKLVFLVEARTDNPHGLRVGQPVTVTLQAPPPEPNR